MWPKVRNSDAVDEPNNAKSPQTLHSAHRSCERAKVFNNAACVSMSACRRGQCGRERVAWSLLRTSIFQGDNSLAEIWSPVIKRRLILSFVKH